MNCFYHHDISAIGMCKNCYKGLCADCIAEVNGSIACLKTCQDEVAKLDRMIGQSDRTYKNLQKWDPLLVVNIAFGAFFIIYGFINFGKSYAWLMLALGAWFSLGGVITILRKLWFGEDKT